MKEVQIGAVVVVVAVIIDSQRVIIMLVEIEIGTEAMGINLEKGVEVEVGVEVIEVEGGRR